jgi:hypothetical protein
MPSATYQIFREALLHEKQVACSYGGYPRELCPIILGHTRDEEKVLAYQVGGSSKSGLPHGGEWRCLFLARVSNARMRDGPWREGARHQAPQSCVEAVDLDVNIHVRKCWRQ